MACNDVRLSLLKIKYMSYDHVSLYMDATDCPSSAVTHWRLRIFLEVGLLDCSSGRIALHPLDMP